MKTMRMTAWIAVAGFAGQLLCGSTPVALGQPARNIVSNEVAKPVSINKATSEELQIVRGIGPALAERIIGYRDANGGFKSMDELREVRGIGDLKFERIKSQLTL